MDARFSFVSQTEWSSTAGTGWGSGWPVQLPLLGSAGDAAGAGVTGERWSSATPGQSIDVLWIVDPPRRLTPSSDSSS